MARQSTRHKYKTRREKNAGVARTTRILLLAAALLTLLLLLKNWREYYDHWRTYLQNL